MNPINKIMRGGIEMTKFWKWMCRKGGHFVGGWTERDWLDNYSKQMLVGYMQEYMRQYDPDALCRIFFNTINQYYSDLKNEIITIK